MIPFFNSTQAEIDRAVSSALNQNYQNDRLTVWVYDDASDNPDLIGRVCDNIVVNFHPQNDWGEIQNSVHATDLLRSQTGLVCIRSMRHLGPGKYTLV